MNYYFSCKNFLKLKQTLFICFIFSLAVFLIPQVVYADSLGEVHTFYIDSSYDHMGRSEITATLRKVGKHSYFYAEDSYWNKLSSFEQNILENNISNLSQEFDETVYPKEREVFGEEFSPGIDNDSKVTVLLTEMSESPGGYFNPNDEYPKEQISDGRSNEREMIYLNIIYLSSSRAKAFLAHEFQHLISWNQKENLRGVIDEVWLNEARSEYAPTLCGYDDIYKGSNLEARVNNFLLEPSNSLTEWQNSTYDYSPINLFIQYLVEHYGENILKLMMKTDAVGIASIDAALKEIGSSKTFSDVFTDWTVANYINDIDISSGQYGYTNPDLNYNTFHISPTDVHQIFPGVNLNVTTSIKDWASYWYVFDGSLVPLFDSGKDILKLDFQGEDSGNFRVPYITTTFDGKSRVNFFALDAEQNGTVYISDFGRKISSVVIIPSSQTKRSGFTNKGNEPLHSFSYFAEMTSIFSKWPDGTLLKSRDDFKVYLVEKGFRRWIKSQGIFLSRWNWEDVKIVEKQELNSLPLGSDVDTFLEGTLIKGTKPYVYVISNEKKRWIKNLEVFNALGYKWENILSVSEEELNSIPNGCDISNTNIHPDGSLIKGTSDKVYFIENGLKRWIKNPDVFTAYGFKWKNVILVSDAEIDRYPLGLVIE